MKISVHPSQSSNKSFWTKGTDCLSSEPCDKAQTVQEMKTLGVADDVGRRHRYFAQLYLVHSPGSQRKLKHYLLNHVLVKTNISRPSVQEDDLMQLSAPTLRQRNSDQSISAWSHCLRVLLTWKEKGRCFSIILRNKSP